MGNPVFKFSLSHTPRTSSSSAITLPDNSSGVNIGSGESWSAVSVPSVTLPGDFLINPTKVSKIYAIAYTFGSGLTYTINYSIGYNMDPNSVGRFVEFFVLDDADNTLFSEQKFFPGDAGTLNESSSFTTPSGAVKYGFLVQIQNTPSTTGTSYFEIINNITGTVATTAETGNPETIVISEPVGWKDSKIKMERHPEFCSLVEYFETGLTYYGENNVDNGGIDFIKSKEARYGYDTTIEETIQADIDGDGVFEENIFTGLKDLSGLQEVRDNKIEVPTIRNNLWSKFILRLETPVDLRSNTDLDGNPVSPVEPVDINLPSQIINQFFFGFLPESTYNFNSGLPANDYIQIDFDDTNDFLSNAQKEQCIDEIDEHIRAYPVIDNPEQPNPSFDFKFPGDVIVNNLTIIARHATSDTTTHLDADIKGYIFDGTTEHLLTRTDYLGSNGTTRRTRFVFTGIISNAKSLAVYLKNDSGSTSSAVGILFDDQVTIGVPSTFTSRFDFYVKTRYQSTQAQGFYIHDAFAGVIHRITGSDSFYSEILGRIDTNMRQYDANGCYSKNIVIRGLQLRGYTLDEKPLSVSFMQLWKGANPIFNLGLGYETILGAERIVIKSKSPFYDTTSTSVNFSNVRQIVRDYDADKIYNKIEVGYNRWQSEDISGNDDPQTKRTYATRVILTKNTLNINSDFIAASIAIETTRRQKREKSKDYKYDNETFIIAINDNDVSPDRYQPELNENFDSITGLINSETRYNSILTPVRSLLRWANVWNGCLQPYQSSFLKFVSGEGNFDMSSDYSCSSGAQCLGVICDNISEKQDIPLGAPNNYGSLFGYLHLPMLYTVEIINFSWSDYLAIRNNRGLAIGISQTDTDHKRFFIKELTYEICKGKCRIVAWPYDYLNMSVVPTPMPDRTYDETIPFECSDLFVPEYIAILDYATAQGFTLPSDEQQCLQNQFLIDLKVNNIWDNLDVLYVFATDGSEDFAKINWINPGTFTPVENGTVTFTSNVGFQGNGTNGYLNTGYIPSTHAVNYLANDASAFCYINNEVAGTTFDFGTNSGVLDPSIFLISRDALNRHSYRINSPSQQVAGSGVSSIGFFQIQKRSTESKFFKNGSQVGSDVPFVATGVPARFIPLFANNNNGSIGTFSNRQMSVFGLGSSLEGNESALSAAWNTYFSSI